MRLFGKNKIKTNWSFAQNQNIFKFIFGGRKFIAGETRDIENKALELFTLDYTNGKTYLKNFSFEENNYWVSIEGAAEKILFLGRFEKPELPYQKNIIALDIQTGKKLWENEIYSFLFNTESVLYGIKKGFESNQIVEISMLTGEIIRTLKPDEHLEVFNLRNSNEDYVYENSNYPVLFVKENAEKELMRIFDSMCYCKYDIGAIEYIQKGSLLIFNYYIKFTTKESNQAKNLFENRFTVYNTSTEDILFEEVLNKSANYCVPDNFFIKDNYLFYLKEKKELHCINLTQVLV